MGAFRKDRKCGKLLFILDFCLLIIFMLLDDSMRLSVIFVMFLEFFFFFFCVLGCYL